MVEDLLRSSWSQRPTPLAFGAEIKRLLTTHEATPRDCCGLELFLKCLSKSLLRQVCIGATPSALLLSYLHHCLAVSILKPLHFFELLTSYANTGRPLQLGALLDTAEEFILYIKPSMGLKEYYLSLLGDAEAEVSDFEKDSLGIVQILAQTCLFMAEIVSGKIKRSQLQAMNDCILDNTLTAVRILRKVALDNRTYPLLVVATHRFPGVVEQLKSTCEASVQVLLQEGGPLRAAAAKDLQIVVERLLRIEDRRRGNGFTISPSLLRFQELHSTMPASIAFHFFLHYKLRRRLNNPTDDSLAFLEKIILAKELPLERAVFELFAAGCTGLACARHSEGKMNPTILARHYLRESHLWSALISCHIPGWLHLLRQKDPESFSRIPFDSILISLTQYPALMGPQRKPQPPDLLEEIVKSLLHLEIISLEIAKKVLGTQTVEPAVRSKAADPTTRRNEDAILTVIAKNDLTLARSPEAQFRATVDAVLKLAALFPSISLQAATYLVELLKFSLQSSPDHFAHLCRTLPLHPFLLDLLNLHNLLSSVLSAVERYCNHWKLQPAPAKELSQINAFSAAFFLLCHLVDRYELREGTSEAFSEGEGFCALWFSKSAASLGQLESLPQETDQQELSLALSSLFQAAGPTLSEGLRTMHPHHVVAVLPYLALQACSACEARQLPYAQVLASLVFAAQNPHLGPSMVGLIWRLSEELTAPSSDWEFFKWGSHDTAVPLPLAIISDLITANHLSSAVLHIVAPRLRTALSTLGVQPLIPLLSTRVDSSLTSLGISRSKSKGFDKDLREEFSRIVERGTLSAPQSTPPADELRFLDVDVFSTALQRGGARYFAAAVVQMLLSEARQGRGLRAADLASALVTHSLAAAPNLSPEHVLAALFSQVLPAVFATVTVSSEAIALAHFVPSCLLFESKEKEAGSLYQDSLVSFTLLLTEVVQATASAPSPLLLFVTTLFSHTAISRSSLPRSSRLKFAGLLRSLRREDLLLNLFDLRAGEEQVACAKIFAFPLRIDKFDGRQVTQE